MSKKKITATIMPEVKGYSIAIFDGNKECLFPYSRVYTTRRAALKVVKKLNLELTNWTE